MKYELYFLGINVIALIAILSRMNFFYSISQRIKFFVNRKSRIDKIFYRLGDLEAKEYGYKKRTDELQRLLISLQCRINKLENKGYKSKKPKT